MATGQLSFETKTCVRCGQVLPIDEFYFVSRTAGTRRGQCKACVGDLKLMRKDPAWVPACARCAKPMERAGPGRRLCQSCFDDTYDQEDRRPNGSHRAKLKPCSACGHKRLREDHMSGGQLCPICRAVPQGRRKALRLYNLSPRNYLQLLEIQSYECSICLRAFTKARVPHVDHQHKEPMIVRGLVCASCNTILALARDDASLLRGAAKYLECPPMQALIPGLVATPEANRRDDYRPLKRTWTPPSKETR